MARILAQDFERQANTTDLDQTTGSPTAANTTSPIHGSSDSLCATLTSATQKAIGINLNSANVVGPFYIQFWFKINTLPSAENTIAVSRNGNTATGAIGIRLTLDNTGVLRLYNSTTAQVGSASPALATGTKYYIEMLYNSVPAGGSEELRARVNGIEFAGAANLTLTTNTTRVLWLGGNINLEAQTTGSWQFDDVVVDDAAYPSGTRVLTLKPNSAGDNNAWSVNVGGTAGAANNFTRVNETIPDNATSYNGSNTAGQLDDYNLAATPAEVLTNASVPCAYVANRGRGGGTSANATYKMRIKASASGTTAESGAMTPPGTAFNVNEGGANGNLQLSNFINALDPTGAAWAKASLDASQIGLNLTAASTNEADITTLWSLFEFGNILFDTATSSGYEASLSTYNWSHTFTGTNRGVIINVSIFAAGSVTSITVGSSNAIFVRTDTNGVYTNEVWRLENPSSGAQTITVNLSASVTSIASASSYSGVHQGNMVEADNGANGSNSTPSVSVTTVSDQAWVVSGLSSANTTETATSPQWAKANSTGVLGSGAIADQMNITPAGATTAAWSATGVTESWALGAVAIKPYVPVVAAAGGTTLPLTGVG